MTGKKMSEGSFCTILKQSCSPKDNQLFSPTVFFIGSKIYIEAELQDLLKIISLYMPNYTVKWPRVWQVKTQEKYLYKDIRQYVWSK